MARSLESLVDSYHLTEEDINKQITDGHVEDISRSLCGKWRSLPAHLELDPIVVGDIDYKQLEEGEKRSKFFTTWKRKQGSRATYERLISALLIIECTQDAESVCGLLKDAGSVHQQWSEASLHSTGKLHLIYGVSNLIWCGNSACPKKRIEILLFRF